MLDSLRVLALDDEYLIALDAQFILSAFDWLEIVPANSAQWADFDFSNFDIVLLDPESPHLNTNQLDHFAEVLPLVFGLVSLPENDEGRRTAIPAVLKPYTMHGLLVAFAKALEPTQPAMARLVMAAVAASGP
jgi:hypothetical protein